MDTSELLENHIYPRLTAKAIFADLKNLRDIGKGITADCPQCGRADHFFCYANGHYGKCKAGSCDLSRKGQSLSWWAHTANRFGLKTNKDILQKLAEMACVNLIDYSQPRQQASRPTTVEEVRELFMRFGQRAAQSMPDEFAKYLEKRGFDKETMKKAGVIYMEREPMIKALFQAGCSKELLQEAGIFTVGFGEIYQLILPYADENGGCLGFVGRLNPGIQEKRETPKYKNSWGSSKDVPFLFHVANVPRNHKIVIVEGPFDAHLINIKCAMKGVGAVALCGDVLSEKALTLVNESAVPIVVLALDDDDAGRLGTLDLIKGIKKRMFVINNFVGYKDPGDLIPIKGPGKFKELMIGAMPSSTWVFKTVFNRGVLKMIGAGGRLDMLADVAPIYHNIPSQDGKIAFLREARKATLLHESAIKAVVGVP